MRFASRPRRRTPRGRHAGGLEGRRRHRPVRVRVDVRPLLPDLPTPRALPEGWTVTTAGPATTRLRVGLLVTGIHYRHPAVRPWRARRSSPAVGSSWAWAQGERGGAAPTARARHPHRALRPLRRGARSSSASRSRPPPSPAGFQLTDARNEPKPVQQLHPDRHRWHRSHPHAEVGGPLGPALEPPRRRRNQWPRAAISSTSTVPTSAALPRSPCPRTQWYSRDTGRARSPSRPRRRRSRHGPRHVYIPVPHSPT
jgi:hypothetical protein